MTFLLSFIHFFSFLRHLKPKWKWVLNQSMVDVQSWGVKLCINDPDHARLLGTSGRDRKYFTDLEKALSNHIYHCFKTKMPVDRFSFFKCQVFRSSSYPLPNQQSRQAMPTVGMHARVSHVLNTGSSKYRKFSF